MGTWRPREETHARTEPRSYSYPHIPERKTTHGSVEADEDLPAEWLAGQPSTSTPGEATAMGSESSLRGVTVETPLSWLSPIKCKGKIQKQYSRRPQSSAGGTGEVDWLGALKKAGLHVSWPMQWHKATRWVFFSSSHTADIEPEAHRHPSAWRARPGEHAPSTAAVSNPPQGTEHPRRYSSLPHQESSADQEGIGQAF